MRQPLREIVQKIVVYRVQCLGAVKFFLFFFSLRFFFYLSHDATRCQDRGSWTGVESVYLRSVCLTICVCVCVCVCMCVFVCAWESIYVRRLLRYLLVFVVFLLLQCLCECVFYVLTSVFVCLFCQSNVNEAAPDMKRESEKEWYFGNADKERRGPFSFK